MSLDATTRRQLVEARKKIIAQLDELEFRVTGNSGAWRRRGPQDAGDVYDELKHELGKINQLLEASDEGTGDDQGDSSKLETRSPISDWSTRAPGRNARLWVGLQLGLLAVILLVAIAQAF